jgi:hypothetical protein
MSDHYDTVPPEVMDEMRAQASECTWAEAEMYGETGPEYIDSLTDEEILAHYENQPGGVDQFCRDSGLEVPA